MKCAPLLLLIGGIASGQDATTPAATRAATQPTHRPSPPAPVVLAPEKNLCAAPSDPVAVGSVQWNGWGRDLFNTRYQPEPAIRAMDVTKLALKWAYGFQGGGTNSGSPPWSTADCS